MVAATRPLASDTKRATIAKVLAYGLCVRALGRSASEFLPDLCVFQVMGLNPMVRICRFDNARAGIRLNRAMTRNAPGMGRDVVDNVLTISAEIPQGPGWAEIRSVVMAHRI